MPQPEANGRLGYPDRVRHYCLEWDDKSGGFAKQGLDDFGRQVLDDLWSDLDEETKGYDLQTDPTWQDEERWELETFVEDRGRGFLGREETVRELCELALSPISENGHVGASVTGEAGSGKSSLFAHLYRTLQEEDVLLLGQAAGISLRSQQVDSLLRRWIGELAAFLEEDDPSTEINEADELESTFASLLGRASLRKRVVVLIDALNQFEPTVRAGHLTWLPKLWPENARVIATAIPGTSSGALEQRPAIQAVTLPPLTQIEAEQIVRAVCRRYHRGIHPDIVQRLIAKESAVGTPAAGIPLWLELTVEELNLLDADDFQRVESDYEGTPEQRLHQLLLDTVDGLPPTVTEIYSAMLKRTEEVVGAPLAQGFANLISLSRSGWRESDLEVLLPRATGEDWNALQFAILRRLFRAHLVRRGVGGQYDFFHQQMRQAVHQRSLQDTSLIRELHTHIADYLMSIPAEDELRQSESMFHLIGTDDRLRAARYYSEALDHHELASSTRAMADHILAEASAKTDGNLDWVLSLPDLEGLSADQRYQLCDRFLSNLADALENEALLATRQKLFNKSRKILRRLVGQDRQDPTNATWQQGLMLSHNKVGDVLLLLADVNALNAYIESLDIARRLSARDPTNVHWVLSCYEKIGDVAMMTGFTADALLHYHSLLNARELVAARNPTCADWQHDVSVSHEKVGDALLAQRDVGGALKAYRESLGVRLRLATQDPTNTAWQHDLSASHNKVGDALLAQGDARDALKAYRESLGVRRRLVALAWDPTSPLWQGNRRGEYGKLEQWSRSLSLYQYHNEWSHTLLVSRFGVFHAILSHRTIGPISIVGALAVSWGAITLGRWSGWWWIVSAPVTACAVLYTLTVAIMQVRCVVQRLRYRRLKKSVPPD